MKTKLALVPTQPNYPQIPHNLQPTLDSFREVAEEAPKHFLGMGDAIPYMVATLLGGQHCILLGKPGTAKTAVTEFLMKSLLPDSFFKKTLSAGVGLEDLFGTMKMTELARDKWLRKWAGVATNAFVFLDEIGTAPDFVVNEIKEAMVSRCSSTVDETHEFPLHSLFAGSNESLVDNPAIWDRFTSRIVLQPISNVYEQWEIIGGDVTPINLQIDLSTLPLIRSIIRMMVESMSIQVKDKWVNVHTQITQKWELTPSSRRLKDGFNVVAARALLAGRAHIEPHDLIALRYVYPHDPKLSSYRDIQQYFAILFGEQSESVDSELTTLLRTLKDEVERLNLADRAVSTQLLMKIRVTKKKFGQGALLDELNELEKVVSTKLGV